MLVLRKRVEKIEDQLLGPHPLHLRLDSRRAPRIIERLGGEQLHESLRGGDHRVALVDGVA